MAFEGWVRLHRNLADHPLWLSEKFTRAQAWVDLIMLANHKPGHYYCRGNRVDVDRGQVGWSEIKLAERWHWSRGKVRRFLKELESDHQIVQQKTFVTSLITIVNYEKWQADDTANGQQTDSRRTADGTQTRINKNKKENTHTAVGPKRELSTVPDLRTVIPVDFHPSQATIDYCAARQLPDPTDQQALDDFIHTNQSSQWTSANWDAEYRKFLPKWRLRNDKETGKPKRNRAERYFDALRNAPEGD